MTPRIVATGATKVAATPRRDPGVETVFLMTSEDNSYVSSKLVKEVASLGGDVSAVVPSIVHQALAIKMAERRKGESQ